MKPVRIIRKIGIFLSLKINRSILFTKTIQKPQSNFSFSADKEILHPLLNTTPIHFPYAYFLRCGIVKHKVVLIRHFFGRILRPSFKISNAAQGERAVMRSLGSDTFLLLLFLYYDHAKEHLEQVFIPRSAQPCGTR